MRAAEYPRVGDYLGAVARSLPGSSAARADILVELGDGLVTASEENERAGMRCEEAVEVALRQYGDPVVLAQSFLPELAVARARRVVLLLFATGPVVAVVWLAAIRSVPDRRSFSGIFGVAGAAHMPALLLVVAMLGSGVWVLALTGRFTQRFALRPRASLLGAASMAAITAVADLAALALFIAIEVAAPGATPKVALAAAMLTSAVRLSLASRAGRSCLGWRTA